MVIINLTTLILLSSSCFLVSSYVISDDISDSIIIGVDDSPVLVELYYESFCPGCRAFITTMLYPTFDKLRDAGIMKVGIYPYGNAHQTKNADGSWTFDCQHGEKECLGNILEVCIMQQLNWDSDMYLPVISCMEGSDDPVSSAKGCVRDLSSVSYDAVKTCAAGKEGNKLEHSMGVKTESLDPPHKYVPWVVVNGEHTDELQEKAQSDLLGLVCSLYQGPQPAECNTGETVQLGGGEIQLDWA